MIRDYAGAIDYGAIRGTGLIGLTGRIGGAVDDLGYWAGFLGHCLAGRDVVLVDAGGDCREVDETIEVEWPEDGKELLEALRRSPARVGILTSGTTGVPRCIWQRVEVLAATIRLGRGLAEQVWVTNFERSHLAGVLVALQVFTTGSVFFDLRSIRGRTVMDLLGDPEVTRVSLTPSFFRTLETTRVPVNRSIRSCTFGGEAVAAGDFAKARDWFPEARVRNQFASTEGAVLFRSDGETFVVEDESGVRVRDGVLELAADRIGEWEGRRLTADGWFWTGDRVEVVSTGPMVLRFVGREGRTLNIGGLRVEPDAVEAALRAHPAVRDALVEGKSNPVTGTLVVARWTGDREGVSEAELRRYLAGCLPREAVPRLIEWVAVLPMTASGKVRREIAAGGGRDEARAGLLNRGGAELES